MTSRPTDGARGRLEGAVDFARGLRADLALQQVAPDCRGVAAGRLAITPAARRYDAQHVALREGRSRRGEPEPRFVGPAGIADERSEPAGATAREARRGKALARA